MVEVHPGISINPDAVQAVRACGSTVKVVLHHDALEIACGNQTAEDLAASIIAKLDRRRQPIETKSAPPVVVAQAAATARNATGGSASK